MDCDNVRNFRNFRTGALVTKSVFHELLGRRTRLCPVNAPVVDKLVAIGFRREEELNAVATRAADWVPNRIAVARLLPVHRARACIAGRVPFFFGSGSEDADGERRRGLRRC